MIQNSRNLCEKLLHPQRLTLNSDFGAQMDMIRSPRRGSVSESVCGDERIHLYGMKRRRSESNSTAGSGKVSENFSCVHWTVSSPDFSIATEPWWQNEAKGKINRTQVRTGNSGGWGGYLQIFRCEMHFKLDS